MTATAAGVASAPLQHALDCGDMALVALAIKLEQPTGEHLGQALDAPDRGFRLKALRALIQAGASPTQGHVGAMTEARMRGLHAEAWAMEAAWKSCRRTLGPVAPGT